MSQIEELQGRIAAAMDRLGAGAEALSQKADAAGPDPETEAALEEEKLANSQLQERLKAVTERHAEELAELQAKLADSDDLEDLKAKLATQGEALARLDMDVQRVRMSNDQLRANNEELRKAVEDGLSDPQLVNKAMLLELEALRAARATDAAEAAAVLARLDAIVSATPTEEAV